MKIGTWVQFEKENKPLGYIISKDSYTYRVRPTAISNINLSYLEFDIDGYASEFERSNKINRIIEFRA